MLGRPFRYVAEFGHTAGLARINRASDSQGLGDSRHFLITKESFLLKKLLLFTTSLA
jgi:hypothetical protein